MRVNVYAEEMTDRIEIIGKEIDGHTFTGLRFYLELPVTVGHPGNHRAEGASVYPPVNGKAAQVRGPFMHRPGDDDSSAVTFWGKRDLRKMLRLALDALDAHYGDIPPKGERASDGTMHEILAALSSQDGPIAIETNVGSAAAVFDRAHLRSIVAEAIDRRRWMRELLATEGAR